MHMPLFVKGSLASLSQTTLRAAGLLPQDFVARRSQIRADLLPSRFASCLKIPRRGIGKNL
jgi:hypothetical protein